jgi:hypothetical protein
MSNAEPTGPLTPDEKRRVDELFRAGGLTANERTAYIRRREGHALSFIGKTWLNNVSHQRVDQLYGSAQKKLGYDQTIGEKQRKNKTVAEQRAAKVRRYAFLLTQLLDTEGKDEWLMLIQMLPNKHRAEFAHERVAASTDEERLWVECKWLNRPLRERMEKLGLYFNDDTDEYDWSGGEALTGKTKTVKDTVGDASSSTWTTVGTRPTENVDGEMKAARDGQLRALQQDGILKKGQDGGLKPDQAQPPRGRQADPNAISTSRSGLTLKEIKEEEAAEREAKRLGVTQEKGKPEPPEQAAA